MSNYTVDTSVIIDVYQSGTRGLNLGFDSIYTSIVHPGSNKKIEGWQWDKRIWPDTKELNSIEYAPSIWDPTSSFLENSYWQSGIGDNKDLLLFSILGLTFSGTDSWIPKINHGYFYDKKNEWYLFSDDYFVRQFSDDQVYSGLQYLDLEHNLKPGTPVKVRRYRWDKENQEYITDLDFRKRVYFTGTTFSGIEADTENDDGHIIFENIDESSPEFVIDYYGSGIARETPRVWLNKDYSETIADSGNFVGYEFLGFGDGYSDKFYTRYSPIDESESFELISYISSGSYETWKQIDSLLGFSAGGSYEYKLDPILGIVSFGDYDETIGSGLVPSVGLNLAARYIKGISFEYEPENSRDFVYASETDTSSLKNPFNKGFLTVGTQDEIPLSIVLTSDLPTGSNYQTSIAGLSGQLIATVRSINNNLLSGQNVTFEIIAPSVGSLSSSVAKTALNGQAQVTYTPPNSIDDIGKTTTDFLHSGLETILSFEDLSEPSNNSGVLLFGIHREDTILGFPASGENSYYLNYLNGNGIKVNPTGTEALTDSGIDFESLYRQQFDILDNNFIDDTDSSTISTGKRIVEYENNPAHIHPHSGAQMDPVYSPIFPIRYSDVGTVSSPEIELVYDGLLTPFNDQLKAYFAVTETTIDARAYLTHPKTGRRIYSNTISLDVNILDKSDGILNCDSSSDVPDGLFTEVRNLNNYSDDWIITETSGELYSTYLDDRLASGEQGYRELYPDSGVIALYHFNGNLEAEQFGGYRSPGEGYGVDFIEKDGYWKQSLNIDNSTDYVLATGLHVDFPYNKGVLEFGYKAPYGDYLLGSGIEGYPVDTLCHLLGLDDNISGAGVIVTAGLVGDTPNLAFTYGFGGNEEVLMYPIHQTDLTDGKWHQIKTVWNFDRETTTSGELSFSAFIDNIKITEIENVSYGHNEVGYITSGQVSIAGINPINYHGVGSYGSAHGFYEELRVTSGEDTEHTFQSWYDLSYESYEEWFRRVRSLDSNTIGLNSFVFAGDCPSTISVGFRLKDDNTNVASVIGHRTFYDINDPLDPYDYITSGIDIYEEYY